MNPSHADRVTGHVVLSLDVGGLERVVATLALAQHRAGSRVSVYCMDRAGELAASLPEAGVAVHTIGRSPGHFDPAAVLRLARALRAGGVRVVHAHNYGALVYAALAARLLGSLRVVYTIHGAVTSGRRATLWFRRLRLVDEIVFVSEHARAIGRRAGISTDAHVHTIVNGVDLASFAQPDGGGDAVRRELGIPDGAPVCGIVARLTVAKDHLTLFDALVSLRVSFPGIHCLVVGDGELRGELEAAVRQRQLESRVHFVGARRNVADYLAAMDVFVLSSVTEGLAMTLLEAMAAGRPIVATRVGGNPEAVADGETGIIVEPRDPAALAMAVGALLGDPRTTAAMADAARERVRERFSLDAMRHAYDAVYAGSGGPATG